MKTYRKFYNTEGKEVEAKDAVKCHEIVTDDEGVVQTEAWYTAEEEKGK